MGDKSKIEWTDATWNPVRGCSRVSEGCRNCYAERHGGRFCGPGQPWDGFVRNVGKEAHWTGRVELVPHLLDLPLRWRKGRSIFVNSMSDLFHEGLDDAGIDRVFAVMALAPQHRFQVLTKRTEGMPAYLEQNRRRVWELAEKMVPAVRGSARGFRVPVNWGMWPLPNVWLGASVENQATADERLPPLLRVAALGWPVFVSYEPALGPVDWGRWLGRYECGENSDWRGLHNPTRERCNGCGHVIEEHPGRSVPEFCPKCGLQDFTFMCPECGGYVVHDHPDTPAISALICGGESGPGARPMHPDWARAARDACTAAGVDFCFKQWGQHFPLSQYVESWPGRNSDIWNAHGRVTEVHENGERFLRVGKGKAGRLLDGVLHDDLPWRSHAR